MQWALVKIEACNALMETYKKRKCTEKKKPTFVFKEFGVCKAYNMDMQKNKWMMGTLNLMRILANLGTFGAVKM
jgi:hypothetical protein